MIKSASVFPFHPNTNQISYFITSVPRHKRLRATRTHKSIGQQPKARLLLHGTALLESYHRESAKAINDCTVFILKRSENAGVFSEVCTVQRKISEYRQHRFSYVLSAVMDGCLPGMYLGDKESASYRESLGFKSQQIQHFWALLWHGG